MYIRIRQIFNEIFCKITENWHNINCFKFRPIQASLIWMKNNDETFYIFENSSLDIDLENSEVSLAHKLPIFNVSYFFYTL